MTEPSAPALQGVARIRESIDTVRRHLNKHLRLAGIVVNLMPPRGREATLRLEELIDTLSNEVWMPPVPRRAVLTDAIGACRPLSDFGGDAALVTRVLDEHLARLMWLDPAYRKTYPARDPALNVQETDGDIVPLGVEGVV